MYLCGILNAWSHSLCIQVTPHCAHVLSRNLQHGLVRASYVDIVHAHVLFTTGLEHSCACTSTASRNDGMFLMQPLKCSL